MKKNRFLFLICILLLIPSGARAQYEVRDFALSGGGNYASGDHTILFTLSQTGFTYASGPANTIDAGFWRVAWLSSTLEVAMRSFTAEYDGEGVLLRWEASSSAAFDGFNIYRGDGVDPKGYTRINDTLIPPDNVSDYLDESAMRGRVYTYRISAVENGMETMSSEAVIEIPPGSVTLYHNYPNPFNPSTSISFYLPFPSAVSLAVFDAGGRRVRILENGVLTGGRYSVQWDGSNDSGSPVSSGVYYCRLKAGKKQLTSKMVLLR